MPVRAAQCLLFAERANAAALEFIASFCCVEAVATRRLRVEPLFGAIGLARAKGQKLFSHSTGLPRGAPEILMPAWLAVRVVDMARASEERSRVVDIAGAKKGK